MATGRGIHIDRPLSNMAVAAFNAGMDGMIAPLVMPPVPVDKQSDLYYIIQKGAFLRIHDTKRSPKTKANRIEFDVSSNSYFAHNYALGGDNSLEDLSNADRAVMLRQNTTDLVLGGLARDQERRVANIVTSGSNLGSYVALSGTNKWNDFVSSDPIADVTTGHAFIQNNTGLMANTAIIDKDTLAVIRRHPGLLDMYKYTSGGEVTDAQLMAAFKVQRILVGAAVMENALEGGTSSMTNIWGNNFVLAHIKSATGPKTATFGLSFRWTPEGFPAPMQVARQVFSGPGTENIEVLEAQYFQDERVVASELAYGITNTL